MNYLLCFLPFPLGVTRKTVKFNLCTKRTDKNLLLHEMRVRKMVLYVKEILSQQKVCRGVVDFGDEASPAVFSGKFGQTLPERPNSTSCNVVMYGPRSS